MPSERIQRRIDALLDEADEAVSRDDWDTVRQRANAVLSFDAENDDARSYLQAAQKNLGRTRAAAPVEPGTPEARLAAAASEPDSSAGGRYVVQRFLGEGGKKRVGAAAWPTPSSSVKNIKKPAKPGSTEPATRFGCRDTQTGAPLKLG